VEFEFNEDQIAIRDLASGLFQDFCTDEDLQKFWATGSAYDAELWQQLRATGLLALSVDETAGGSGMGMQELMLVLEQQGRALAPVPLWRHQLAVTALARFAGSALRSVVPTFVDGSALISLGLEGVNVSQTLALEAESRGDGWILNGRANAVPHAGSAGLLLLPARSATGTRLFAFPPDRAGVELQPGWLTHQEPAADVVCHQVELDSAAALDEAALGWVHPRAIACNSAGRWRHSRHCRKRWRTATSTSKRCAPRSGNCAGDWTRGSR
jgi:alkylation response protein AidB-like acyl-CoA dehydrogenase